MAAELVACTALVDVQRFQGAFLDSAAAARRIADLYTAAFSGAGLRPRSPGASAGPRRSGRTRVLFLTFQICEGQAAAVSLARWIELLDPARFETAVLCADELTERRPALGIVPRLPDRSDRHGPALVARMRATRGCTGGVTLLPTDGDWIDAARAGLAAAESFAPDVAVFVASPACPVQAALAHRRIAPLQVNMNIGVCLPIDGMDTVVYHNDLKADDDAATLATLSITQHRVVTIGTDLRPCLTVRPVSRAQLGVPEDVVLLACVANKIAHRLLFDGFIDGLTACLGTNTRAWWVGVGGGETDALRARLEQAGVADRCVLTGSVADPRPLLAAVDIMLNEYPEGGGNTVLEAMGVGTPVAAMRAGRRHAETIGAILAGEFASPDRDRAAYWRLVQRWIDDPADRKRVGAAMKERAHREFDYAGIVRRYEDFFLAQPA